MRKVIITLAVSTFMATAILTSCSSPAEKVEKAEEKVIDAHDDLNKAQAEYAADIEKFRKENDEKIAANKKRIAEFDARIVHEKAEARAEYKKKIAELDQKNTDMKKRMDEYKADGKDQWEQFKAKFNEEMNDLGNALKKLTK